MCEQVFTPSSCAGRSCMTLMAQTYVPGRRTYDGNRSSRGCAETEQSAWSSERAAERGVAILGILHLNNNVTMKALYRVSDRFLDISCHDRGSGLHARWDAEVGQHVFLTEAELDARRDTWWKRVGRWWKGQPATLTSRERSLSSRSSRGL